MNKPIVPNKNDCCNSGCNPCIFDVYEKRVKLYNKFVETNDESLTVVENGISQLEYTTFIVIDIKKICDTMKQIKFRKFEIDKLNSKVTWQPGAHFLVKYYSELETCTRAYTPIKLRLDTDKEYDFSIVVKKYDMGLVSNYLFNLIVGEKTIWRGPFCSYEITKLYCKIIMFAQGTGLAPFISIIDNILDDEDNLTTVTLLYCCQTINNILYRNELYNFRSYWNFTYKIFISNFTEDNKLKYEEPIVKQRLTFEDLDSFLQKSEDYQFLLSGCSQFMNEYKVFLLSANVLGKNIITF